MDRNGNADRDPGPGGGNDIKPIYLRARYATLVTWVVFEVLEYRKALVFINLNINNVKRKFLILLVLTVLTGCATYSQELKVGPGYTIKTPAQRFNVNKLYYKGTEIKVPESVFKKLIQENPRLNLEREFDAEGNVVRYLYDPN